MDWHKRKLTETNSTVVDVDTYHNNSPTSRAPVLTPVFWLCYRKHPRDGKIQNGVHTAPAIRARKGVRIGQIHIHGEKTRPRNCSWSFREADKELVPEQEEQRQADGCQKRTGDDGADEKLGGWFESFRSGIILNG